MALGSMARSNGDATMFVLMYLDERYLGGYGIAGAMLEIERRFGLL